MEFKTLSANKNTVQKEWLLVDATDQILGRLASKVAKIIRGKYKPNYTPHVDCGDNVVIINAEKIQFSGQKWSQRSQKAEDLLVKDPTRIIRMAVKGMLPKNKLGSALNKNIYIYTGSDHKNQGQKPKLIDLKDF